MFINNQTTISIILLSRTSCFLFTYCLPQLFYYKKKEGEGISYRILLTSFLNNSKFERLMLNDRISVFPSTLLSVLNIPRDHFSPIPSISALFHSSFVCQAFLLSSLSKLSTGFVFSHFIFTSSLLLLSCFFLTWIYSFITNSGPKSWGSIMV